jgi:hypothetical protein
MQTFLPYPDFEKSARSLDYKRLGKQRVETLQLLQAISQTTGESGKKGLSRGWQFHPASRMWAMEDGKYLLALLKYQEAVIKVWLEKGYKDTCWEKSKACFTDDELARYEAGDYEMPPWFGDEDFHMTHRNRLMVKDPEYYGEKFPEMARFDPSLDYIWPGPSLEEAKLAMGIEPKPLRKKKAAKGAATAFRADEPSEISNESELIAEDVEELLREVSLEPVALSH